MIVQMNNRWSTDRNITFSVGDYWLIVIIHFSRLVDCKYSLHLSHLIYYKTIFEVELRLLLKPTPSSRVRSWQWRIEKTLWPRSRARWAISRFYWRFSINLRSLFAKIYFTLNFITCWWVFIRLGAILQFIFKIAEHSVKVDIDCWRFRYSTRLMGSLNRIPCLCREVTPAFPLFMQRPW